MALPMYGDSIYDDFDKWMGYKDQASKIKGSGYTSQWESNPSNYTPSSPGLPGEINYQGGSYKAPQSKPPSDRGGLSKREYEKKYGVKWEGGDDDDDYWKEIEEARKKQTKATNKQFDDLLEALGLQYEGYESKAKKSFDARQLEDIQALTRRHKA